MSERTESMGLVELLRDEMPSSLNDSCRKLELAADEIDRLRGCLAAIQKATLEGRVCDDVAWFDTITTLHDFCDAALGAQQ